MKIEPTKDESPLGKPGRTTRLLDQLLRLEVMDRIPRTGYLQRGISNAESVAEHSWHVATVAWTLLPFAAPINDGRVLELALLHDVGERLLGDLPRPAKRLFPERSKEQAEAAAIAEVLEASSDRATVLADELMRRATREARFVHHCDRLQLLLKTATYVTWNEGASRSFFDDLTRDLGGEETEEAPRGASEFPVFRELQDALIRRIQAS